MKTTMCVTRCLEFTGFQPIFWFGFWVLVHVIPVMEKLVILMSLSGRRLYSSAHHMALNAVYGWICSTIQHEYVIVGQNTKIFELG